MKNLRPEVQACLKSHLPGRHGMNDLMDDMFLSLLNMTDDEFDFMLENVTGEENKIVEVILTEEDLPFAVKRKALEIRDKYLKEFNEANGINNDLYL